MRAAHLYIHVPFCARRCVYCDFSIAVRRTVPAAEFLTALEREWMLRHSQSDFTLETLYFGGGTPSKLGGEGVARLMELVRKRASLLPGAEVTLEANPEDVTRESARAWAASGINRVSLGIQSLDAKTLVWMHRSHSVEDATSAVHALHDAGIPNVSIDLIFGTPSDLPRDWEAELSSALKLDVEHLSIYGLTVEPHTPLGRWVARADVSEAPEETFEEDFLLAHDLLLAHGFEHYEVSNYGKPGFHSRHNWSYWQRAPYGGLGPSAHEFDGSQRRWNVAPYSSWVARTSSGDSSIAGEESLDAAAAQSEELYLSLRTSAGIRISDDERAELVRWIEAGWAKASDDGHLHLSPGGWLRLDALANHLTLLRSRSYI